MYKSYRLIEKVDALIEKSEKHVNNQFIKAKLQKARNIYIERGGGRNLAKFGLSRK